MKSHTTVPMALLQSVAMMALIFSLRFEPTWSIPSVIILHGLIWLPTFSF